MAAVAIDPITTEVIRSAFSSAADEMNAGLIRSAYTPIIYELKDCSVALLDAEHRVLGQSSGLPIFLGNLEICTRLTEEWYGREAWRPGDVWIMNDSYLTGTHLNDVTVFGPIFHAGLLVGFAASRAHWLDVGAKDPGAPMDSTEIFQEGLRLGPTRLVEGGVPRRDMLDLLSRNSRFPQPMLGDLQAQMACVRIGEQRLGAIIDRFGLDVVQAARDRINEQTERVEREIVAAIPDGVYTAEGCLDDDGIRAGEPVWVRVRVTVEGDRMEVDLTESSDLRGGPVNCGEAQAISACRVAYKLLINPHNPPNGGSFRPLTVKVRPGSMLGAQEPYPCQWYFSQLGLLIDLVVKALSGVMPEAAAAASYGDSMVISLSGIDPRNGRPWLDLEPTVGGWGAWHGSDGESGLINNVNGSLKDLTIEVLETKYPMRMTHYGYRTDSGGPGQWRGGNGIIREYTLDGNATLFLWFERAKTPAWGLAGGRDATPPIVVINPGRADERRMLKCSREALKQGDVVRTMTGGGGGFGDPAQRERSLIADDIRNRHVSPEAARERYGY